MNAPLRNYPIFLNPIRKMPTFLPAPAEIFERSQNIDGVTLSEMTFKAPSENHNNRGVVWI